MLFCKLVIREKSGAFRNSSGTQDFSFRDRFTNGLISFKSITNNLLLVIECWLALGHEMSKNFLLCKYFKYTDNSREMSLFSFLINSQFTCTNHLHSNLFGSPKHFWGRQVFREKSGFNRFLSNLCGAQIYQEISGFTRKLRTKLD